LVQVPLTIYRNQSVDFKQKVDAQADDFDVIFVDHYLMFQYVPAHFRGRVIVHQHNAEFVMWSRFAKQTSKPLQKALLNLEAFRIRRYEVKMCRLVDVVLAAPNDKVELIAAGVSDDKFIDTYHLGDEGNLSLPDIHFDNTGVNVLFIGTLTWEANIDGLLWFLEKSWPLIKQLVPNVTFTIAGKHTEQLKNKLLKLEPEINLMGFVDDLEDLYQQHRVFVAPLRFGSGIKVKIVNSLYRGIPTVTTVIGAEGLTLKNREHILIENNAVEFAGSVASLLKNKSRWLKISRQSRQFMKNNYTWDVVFQNVSRSLTSCE
jgi:glycosyltransferase involved in cell wall biosynthesis